MSGPLLHCCNQSNLSDAVAGTFTALGNYSWVSPSVPSPEPSPPSALS